MMIRKCVALGVVALMAVNAVEPVLAQGNGRARGNPVYREGYDEGYRDAYRDGYRAGYEDGRGNRRFDDRQGPPRIANDDREDRWRKRYVRTYTTMIRMVSAARTTRSRSSSMGDRKPQAAAPASNLTVPGRS